MLLSQAITYFSQWGASKYSSRTLYTYRHLLNDFLAYVQEDKNIATLTFDDLNDYYTYLKHRRLADSSIAYHLIALRQFWKLLYQLKVTELTYELINVPKYTQQSYPPKGDLIAQQMITAVASADECKAVRDKLIISLLADSGVRVAELCDLKMTDLRIADRKAVIIGKKNRKKRQIFWYERTEVLLAHYLGYWREATKCEYVFISVDPRTYGHHLTTRSVERIISFYGKKANVGWITPHMFRHGLGEDLIKSGVHPRHVQLILGHKRITGTQIYMDVADPEITKTYATFAQNRQYLTT